MMFFKIIIVGIIIPIGIIALILVGPAYIMDYVTNKQKKGKSVFVYDDHGYNSEGYDRYGRDREGFNRQGYDRDGYDREGFNIRGYDREGYDKSGYNADGFDRSGFNKDGYDKDGHDRNFDMNLNYTHENYNRSSQNERKERPKEESGSYEFFIKVAGVTYDNRQSVISKLKAGDSLRFVPEPHNRFDHNAVKVETITGEQIGYIPKEKNKNIFRNLTNNKGTYQVAVSNIRGGEYNQSYGVNARVSYTPGKSYSERKHSSEIKTIPYWKSSYYEDPHYESLFDEDSYFEEPYHEDPYFEAPYHKDSYYEEDWGFQDVEYSDFETYYGGMDDDYDEYS